MEHTVVNALAAAGAESPVDLHDAVLHVGGVDRTALRGQTSSTAVAVLGVILRHPLPHDAEVVEGGLDAVVGAAADPDFKLVGQLYVVPALVEFLMELPGQGLGVDEAVDAHGALAGHNGPDPGPGAAGVQAALLEELVEGFNGLIGKSLDFHGHAGSHGNGSAAELLGGLGGHHELLTGEDPVLGDNAAYKMLPIPGHNVAAALQGLLLGIGDLHVFPCFPQNLARSRRACTGILVGEAPPL